MHILTGAAASPVAPGCWSLLGRLLWLTFDPLRPGPPTSSAGSVWLTSAQRMRAHTHSVGHVAEHQTINAHFAADWRHHDVAMTSRRVTWRAGRSQLMDVRWDRGNTPVQHTRVHSWLDCPCNASVTSLHAAVRLLCADNWTFSNSKV